MNDWDPEADRRRLECVRVGPAEVRQGDRKDLGPVTCTIEPAPEA